MTDNEQIIIDEIDVGGCEFMIPTATTPKCESNDNIHCDGINCYYKQLKRKEQECKKLKEKFKKFFDIDNQECWDIAFLNNEKERYKQFLDEIEEKLIKFCDDCDGREDNVCKDGCYYSLIPIFKDIINKAKEANND